MASVDEASQLELSPMREEDLGPVTALEASLQDFPWSRGHFADSLASGHSLWVCRLNGDLAGFFVLMTVIDEAHLLNLGVHHDYQGRGCGARLLRHALEMARQSGAERLLLEVRESNRQAADIYRHLGFYPIAVRKDYYPAKTGRENALIFERWIPPLDP